MFWLRLALFGALLAPLPASATDFVACKQGQPMSACVVDGDTFWLDGEKIRPEGYDAPEAGPPRCRTASPLARPATRRLLELLNAGEVAIERHGEDRYGRTLAAITVDGRDIAETMIAEGLGRRYAAGQGAWC